MSTTHLPSSNYQFGKVEGMVMPSLVLLPSGDITVGWSRDVYFKLLYSIPYTCLKQGKWKYEEKTFARISLMNVECMISSVYYQGHLTVQQH